MLNYLVRVNHVETAVSKRQLSAEVGDDYIHSTFARAPCLTGNNLDPDHGDTIQMRSQCDCPSAIVTPEVTQTMGTLALNESENVFAI
jgi:hypothetical protein